MQFRGGCKKSQTTKDTKSHEGIILKISFVLLRDLRGQTAL
jgi:hypothetical protein